jgi:hypothetical protein
MTPADLRRLHKYMLEIEKVTVISDEMRVAGTRAQAAAAAIGGIMLQKTRVRR